MKIILTLAEVNEIVKRHFHLNSIDADIEIIHNYSALSRFDEALRPFLINDNIIYEQKIAAIGAVREACNCGLLDAKSAVENLSLARVYLAKHNKLDNFARI